MDNIVFFDLEITDSKKIAQIGAVCGSSQINHSSVKELIEFFQKGRFIAGHNIVQHDWAFLNKNHNLMIFNELKLIDTLYWSPLLFPQKPYHRLIKDYKIVSSELNNPLSDALLSQIIFQDEVAAFQKLDRDFQTILFGLLRKQVGFAGFFDHLNFAKEVEDLEPLIRQFFKEKICAQADLAAMIEKSPIALAYSLAIIRIDAGDSITPPWVYRNFPQTSFILHRLRNAPCISGCAYCQERLSAKKGLRDYFGFDDFRQFDGMPLQENVVNLGLNNQSLLAIFPTGGGKSLTFQIPALMSGRNVGGLTIVISPLQSLMKDQVDNLEKKGITQAVTINGLLDPIERAKSIERVENGSAWLLYISPESLRSKTITNLMMKRKIVRFVIDEAHCFSSWGQDFRVDYLYIGDFIRKLQEDKQLDEPIPVSCFTATAKQNVIADIRRYFDEKLSLNLELVQAVGTRTNLRYAVYEQNTEEEKYVTLRNLIEAKNCPTIVYVSRTKKAEELAKRLRKDHLNAKCFHGKMPSKKKTKNQDDFIQGRVQIMVATSAFGMGVDKDNVKLVVHYEISNSLENYVQEAGRAGRDPKIEADCFVLFNEEDLHKHFVLLNQTKINIDQIKQVWKAIKQLTKSRTKITGSALEIARQAGWNDEVLDLETRVRTAINALEEAKFLVRKENSPRIYATSIRVKTAQVAIDIINKIDNITNDQRQNAIRIIKKLFSTKSKSKGDEEAESRVDYIADHLGIVKDKVIDAIELMRREKILAHDSDLVAFVRRDKSVKRSIKIVEEYAKIERFILPFLSQSAQDVHLKEWAEKAENTDFQQFSIHKTKELLNLLAIQGIIKQQKNNTAKNHIKIISLLPENVLKERIERKHQLAKFFIEYLFAQAEKQNKDNETDQIAVEFSIIELEKAYQKKNELFSIPITEKDIKDSLFYLSRIGAITIEGGFLVIHNRMVIERKEENNKAQYKKIDYQKLEQFYQSKIEQVHIVGTYAKKMVDDYEGALEFVNDYFSLNYSSFLRKYFNGSEVKAMRRSITPKKFKQLFGDLSTEQLAIVKDNKTPHIAVLAGPGSGKTKVLVHKLTSLLLLEDVKTEQLLMLTFARAAATEFKKRLFDLLGGAAAFVEIKTFHSYCFDLMGKVGDIEKSDTVIKDATHKIKNNEVEINQIAKTVLVIDEGQDISEEEYWLIKALMAFNEGMRVIIVGDDDQNIFSFRGADAQYLRRFTKLADGKTYELLANYRSKSNIVTFANQFVLKINHRLKTQPIQPHSKENGSIKLFRYHYGGGLITPLVEGLKQTHLTGTTCVLTKTNEQAELAMSSLITNQLQAKLIQSNDHFSLLNLQEIRYFLNQLKVDDNSPYISIEIWNTAKQALYRKYQSSPNFDLVKHLIKDFQEINRKHKFKTDLRIFIRESKLEDFLRADNELIYVSTMHKSKGKEFDNVILLLDNFDMSNDEAKRLVYVAMTRAKNNLTIHTNGSYFDKINVPELLIINSEATFSIPKSLLLRTSLKDVNLGFFRKNQLLIRSLSAGMKLQPVKEGLMYKDRLVIKYSHSFTQLLTQKERKGYHIKDANISHLVFWRDIKAKPEIYKELIGGELVSAMDSGEIMVVLVDVWLEK